MFSWFFPSLPIHSLPTSLFQMRDLRHENILPFVGACVETAHVCILTQLCARGNLDDVLNNSNYRLENMFIASLVADLIRGMIYLHDSEIVYHGNLKPSNCLIDSRWVLQISDFGLRQFKGRILKKKTSFLIFHSLMAFFYSQLARPFFKSTDTPSTNFCGNRRNF